MKYYVYKITNTLNGKYYIGKRKHNFPYKDKYMGSGKLIKLAIQKYGKSSFIKEIFGVFDTNDEAALLEAMLVTKEIINTSMSYNMHEGGHGGFAHLNNGSEKHIQRAKKGGKNSKGKLHPNWGKYKWKKGDLRTKKASRIGNIMKEKDAQQNPEKYEKIYKKISEHQKQNNSMKNRCWCVPLNCKNYNKRRKVFHINEIPEGWIKIKEYHDNKKVKYGTYGKIWIHNPSTKENKYCKDKIPEGWFKGRKLEYYQRNIV